MIESKYQFVVIEISKIKCTNKKVRESIIKTAICVNQIFVCHTLFLPLFIFFPCLFFFALD